MKLTEVQMREIVKRVIAEAVSKRNHGLDLRFFDKCDFDNSPWMPSHNAIVYLLQDKIEDHDNEKDYYYINFDTADGNSYDLGGGPDGDDQDISLLANDYLTSVLDEAQANIISEDQILDYDEFGGVLTSVQGYPAVFVKEPEPTVIVYLGK